MLVRFQTDARDFSLLKTPRLALTSNQPFAQCLSGLLFTGVEWPGRTVPNSCGADVRIKWIYTSTPLCTFMSFTGGTLLVAHLVEALRYKPEGRGFDSQWGSLKFFIDIIPPVLLWPWGLLSL